ncbi:MAG: hypothetical protein M3389_03800, partial [Actinomycetota bacterium]|nr:hypothetical protein [Actinomycetota bacterium]
MFQSPVPTVSGHVFRREGKRGAVWYAKYRLADPRQVQKRIRARPTDGWFTKRGVQAWLREVLREAEAGTLPGAFRTGATFADAAAEWLRYVAEGRACKPTTMRDYRRCVRGHFLRTFGDRRPEDMTTRDIERWRAGLTSSARTRNKLLTHRTRLQRPSPGSVLAIPWTRSIATVAYRTRSSRGSSRAG